MIFTWWAVLCYAVSIGQLVFGVVDSINRWPLLTNMRPKQLNVNMLSATNCNLSNSINLPSECHQAEPIEEAEQALCQQYIDQLVDINYRLIQIVFDVKRALDQHCDSLHKVISSQADDMIKIDRDPIKIDDVIGSISQMDGPDNQFVTLERLLTLATLFFLALSSAFPSLSLTPLFVAVHRSIDLFIYLFMCV